MARTARKKSESGIYHVMLRGNNRQQIFFDEEDSRRFIDILLQCRGICGFQLFAYCLMKNHVHLLLQIEEEPLDLVMKRICTRFVMWYNNKYERVGHLFQDRFKSEPVQDDAYFLTVLRYILNNPVKAGICAKPEDYFLSNARDYFKGGGSTDTSFAEKILGRNSLRDFLMLPGEDICMEEDEIKIGEREAEKRFLEIAGGKDKQVCKQIVSEQPNRFIPLLRNAGLSIRQICRLTGVSFGIVRKY